MRNQDSDNVTGTHFKRMLGAQVALDFCAIVLAFFIAMALRLEDISFASLYHRGLNRLTISLLREFSVVKKQFGYL